MPKANVQTKYHPAAGFTLFEGPVYARWPMLQFDHLTAGTP
jgi:hypothetical protein